jgi:hypothetical protein
MVATWGGSVKIGTAVSGRPVDRHAFNQVAAPFEKSASAPYLKRFLEDGGEKIRVLKMNGNGGSWAEATPEEIAAGIYYTSYAEYQRAP